MEPIPIEREGWLPELGSALKSIAMALGDQEPTAERITAARSRFEDAVPDHRVEVIWFEQGYLYEPEIDNPGEPEFAITIYGDRLNAGWLVRATDLPAVLRLSIVDALP